jgi:hypothetical protein
MDRRTNPHVPFYGSFYKALFVFDLKEPFVHEILCIKNPVFLHVLDDAFQ